MNKAFDGVSISGVAKSGQAYIWSDHADRDRFPDPIRYLYAMRTDDEILLAIELEMTLLDDIHEVRKFLGHRRISDDCYQFNLICYDKEDDREIEFSLYLHRLMSFQEKLRGELDMHYID
jgi:hypothetical protein